SWARARRIAVAVAASDSRARSANTPAIAGWSMRSAEDLPVPRVPQRLPEGLAHPRRRAEDVIEPGAGNHLDDRAHPAALLAHEPSGGTGELHLAGSVRPVAELVLQPLDRERHPIPAGKDPRHEETAQSPRCTREH